MEFTKEELEDLAYKLITCTEEEATLIYETLTEWQYNEVLRLVETIVARMETW